MYEDRPTINDFTLKDTKTDNYNIVKYKPKGVVMPESNTNLEKLKDKSMSKAESKPEKENDEVKLVATPVKYGVGLDVGTGFLVGASYGKDSKINYRSIRDAFFSIDKERFNPALFNDDVRYIEFDDSIFIVGENAIEFARTMNTSAKRPLANGIVNPEQREHSTTILEELFNFVVAKHIKKDQEKLFFSIPGPQIPNLGFDTTFHTMSIQSLCNSFGVDSEPLNEAYAVGISELGASKNLTSLNFSFGAGLVNVCLAYRGLSVFEFCVDKSGDFIDQTVARGCGEETAYVCKIKETKLDLGADEYKLDDIEKHLLLSYRFVVKNTINAVVKAFRMSSNIKISEDIPVVVAGGTSMPKGFIDLFEENILLAKLGFEVTNVIHAKSPLTSVSKGCLMWANSMEK